MSKWIIYISIAAVSVIGVSWIYMKSDSTNVICNQPYALCTSAQCIPSPSDPKKVICFCKVREGESLGLTSCDKRVPQITEGDITHLTSTFSLDDFASKKVLTCSSGNPWGDCLDQPCIVDPLDPKKAICSCILRKKKTFQTLGGKCDTSTCSKGFWSGATIKSNTESTQAMLEISGSEQLQAKQCKD